MRDHGGNLDEAMVRYGGTDWIDLSTGINPVAYPVGDLPPRAWQALPTRSDMAALIKVAQAGFGTSAPGVALAGAQAAIQMLPLIGTYGCARVLAPTYNEHAAALRAAGWQVKEVTTPEALAGADLAVIVNPNNPDGRRHAPEALLALAPRVGRLIVDESFADPHPELSVIAQAGQDGLTVLRSFGKFWGLAGLRMGFAFGDAETVAQLAQMAGPWPVAGPAISIATRALADHGWRAATIARLAQDTARLDALAARAGWSLLGGTALFRTYRVPDAGAAQDRLARAHIWTRQFPYAPDWLRLGLPGAAPDWDRLAAALA